MTYKTHTLTQGDGEWHAHRASSYNASDLGAAMGISPYKTRQELVAELANGITKEIDERTQKRFDDGHRFERLARTIAEQVIGDDLSPTTVSISVAGMARRLSASLDGETFGSNENFEHKGLSKALAEAMDAGKIPEQYHPQMEQGMMINGATRCLFMASKWDDDDQLIEEKHLWYESNPELRAKIVPTWMQIEADVANYVHTEATVKAVAAPIADLPVLFVQAKGEVTDTNMPWFKACVTTFIAGLNLKPMNDQEYADGKAIASKLRAGAKALQVKKAEMLAQTASIGEVAADCDIISKQMNAAALTLEKAVETEEANRKGRLIQGGKDKLYDHVKALSARIGITLPAFPFDFAAAIKGKSKFESMENGIAAELTRAKLVACEIADKVEANLKLIDAAGDYAFLFNDRHVLASGDKALVELTIESRIAKHKVDHQKKLDDEREKIRKEEQARAEKEAAAKVAEERAAEIAKAAKFAAELLGANRAAEYPPEAGQKPASETGMPAGAVSVVLAVSSPKLVTCDGNHAGPKCADPECWNGGAPSMSCIRKISDCIELMTDAELLLVLHYCERLLAIKEAEAA
jgi:putative phage-type endonuclease